jgi:hypothetical protein
VCELTWLKKIHGQVYQVNNHLWVQRYSYVTAILVYTLHLLALYAVVQSAAALAAYENRTELVAPSFIIDASTASCSVSENQCTGCIYLYSLFRFTLCTYRWPVSLRGKEMKGGCESPHGAEWDGTLGRHFLCSATLHVCLHLLSGQESERTAGRTATRGVPSDTAMVRLTRR